MKKLFYLLAVTLILGLIITGCTLLSDVSQVPDTGQKYNENNPNPNLPFGPGELVAGQNTIVGNVTVSNDAENLYVKYDTNSGWGIIETHLAVADSLGEIPQTKKENPIPGKFPYSSRHDPAVTEHTHTVPLADLGTELYIAAHANVCKGEVGVEQTETAWAGDLPFGGKNWATYSIYVVAPLAVVGDIYGGGIVAYILQSGDTGYDANVQHGLIAATADQSTGIQWYNGSNVVTGATGTAIGTGQANTTSIVTVQGAGSYAAQLCDVLTEGGYADWFLPSKDELDKLYTNKVAIGGFAVSIYWSSSEFAADGAWSQNFSNGVQNNSNKLNTYRVRAVRAF